jgi:hypothetical protein
MRTTLELFLCATPGSGVVWYHRLAWDITGSKEDPDRLVAGRLADLLLADGVTAPGGDDLNSKSCCAHSTSWRFDQGALVLTYMLLAPATLLASLPAHCLLPGEVEPARAAAPLAPRPEVIRVEQVVVHGLGHLRYLAEERGEPFVSAAARDNELLPVLALFPPVIAGRLYQP